MIGKTSRSDGFRAAASLTGDAAAIAVAALLMVLRPFAGAVAVEVDLVAVLPSIELQAGGASGEGVPLGGMSDLFAARQAAVGSAALHVWAITDRGPNGTVQTPEGKRRTLLHENFSPCLVGITIDGEAASDGRKAGPVEAVARKECAFSCRSGAPITGRPNGVGHDEPIMDAAGTGVIEPDHNGIDSEGIVRLGDGSLWLSEEYRPSLVHLTAEGRVVARYVPEGVSLPKAGYEVHDTLPARYGFRKDNRGFEALAVSPDESILWALLQSPLEFPESKAAKATGNVRLLAFDLRKREPLSEHIYRLGDPADPRYMTHGAPPDDGKLCAMAAINADSILVLEQDDGGLARLYRCSFAGATDTLRDQRAIEPIGNLTAAGIASLRKTLLADLGPLLPRLAADITDGAWQPKPGERVAGLKIEGLAIIGAQRIAIVNDNDFNIDHIQDAARPKRRSCLWILELDEPIEGFVGR